MTAFVTAISPCKLPLELSGPSTHALAAGYGDFQALHSVDFEIREGEIVALIGANGASKSTLLKAIVGLLPVAREMVRFEGEPIGGGPAFGLVRRGIAMVPEGRRLFAGMSVEDNLKVAIDHVGARGEQPRRAWTLDAVYDLFPALRERRRALVETFAESSRARGSLRRLELRRTRNRRCLHANLARVLRYPPGRPPHDRLRELPRLHRDP